MRVERVLDPLKATLLASLAGIDRIAFAGDRATLEYLRTFFASAPVPSDHRYLCVDDGTPTDWVPELGNRRIVVASARREAEIFELLTREAASGLPALSVQRLFADLFVNLACGHAPLESAPVPAAEPVIAYAIVGTPRSGSEFLCNVLRSTGHAGYPEEHLRLESQVLTRYSRFDCVEYFRALMSRRTTPNGVFGTKIISHFLSEHVRLARGLTRDLERLHYIHIVRRDRVGQAISALIAGKIGVWHVRNDEDQDRYRRLLNSVTIADQDLRHVNRLIDGFRRQERRLSKFLRKHRLPTMTVIYEDLVENPAGQLTEILSFLKLDVRVPEVTVSLKPTRSALSDAVRTQYAESPYGRRRLRLARLLKSLGFAPDP